MMSMSLAEAAHAMQSSSPGSDVLFKGISTDSRSLDAGNLFIALQGPNFDGHDYLEQAHVAGAVAATVHKSRAAVLPLIEVDDTCRALGRLASHWRDRFSIPLIAITGSNGKTTVRAMTAAILQHAGKTLSTRGNLNNDIGLPLTLARLAERHQFAVLEMGANHPGEIEYLAGIARPTIAVVTNAGPAHLEGFGDLDGVARAKGELFAVLGENDVAVINADDPYVQLWRELASHARIVEFGFSQTADVRADWDAAVDGSDMQLYSAQGTLELHLPLPGRHNVLNALAASAAALAAGVTLDAVRDGLESLKPVPGRFEVIKLADDLTIIDDTYNANPESLQAALDVLALSGHERWLVLGDMGELGDAAADWHRDMGDKARAAGVDRLYGLGPLAAAAVTAFNGAGGAFSEAEMLIDELQKEVHGSLTVLVKGSRAMRMEHIVEALRLKGES